MHTVVEKPLTHVGRGSISCRPIGHAPITFEWSGGQDGDALRLSEDGSEATDLAPGRYRIRATDAAASEAEVVIDVQPMLNDAVVVHEYRVTHASTSFARDGSVEIVGTGVDRHSYLWSSGAVTTGSALRNVPCGTYVAVALPLRGEAPVFVHSALPAVVEVAGGRWT